MQPTPASILTILKANEYAIEWQQLLSDILTAFDCSTGTIHTLDKDSSLLKLQAHQGIPPFLLPKMEQIPIGKGMAGIAAERRRPVEMCNLQTDSSGVARPAAKETRVEGSLAAPMLLELEGELYGTLGIAKPVSYDFTEAEKTDLMKIGEEISRYLSAMVVKPS